MPGRGPQTFKKRQREQQRKERQQEKMAARLQRKENKGTGPEIAWDEATINAEEFRDDQDVEDREGEDRDHSDSETQQSSSHHDSDRPA